MLGKKHRKRKAQHLWPQISDFESPYKAAYRVRKNVKLNSQIREGNILILDKIDERGGDAGLKPVVLNVFVLEKSENIERIVDGFP